MAQARRVVIVTGASRGLGEAIALQLLRLGANVVASGRSECPQSFKEHTKNDGCVLEPRLVYKRGDISEEAVGRSLVQTAIAKFGRLDAIINNAAISHPLARIADVSVSDWRKNMDTNAIAMITVMQEAIPHLRETNGRIVNISSGAAKLALLGNSAYCCSKAVVNLLTGCVAREEPLICAIALYPGVIDTPMQDNLRDERHKDALGEDQRYYFDYYEKGVLQPPSVPGRATALLALHAPMEWSGRDVRYNDPEVEKWLEESVKE